MAQFSHEITEKRDSLSTFSDNMLNAEKVSDRLIANEQLLTTLKELMEYESSFDYSFDELKTISRLKSDDGKLKIFSWNVPIDRNEQKYYSIIQHLPEEGSYHFYVLRDIDTNFQDIINFRADVANWPGALYLQIVEKHAAYKTYYTLLGWNGNSALTSIKLVDVLSFNKSGEPEFGEGIFKVGKEIQSRMIFEYAATNKMILEYRPDLDLIIFDHLSPPRTDLQGLYEYYGPDFSFDALQWSGRQWIYTPDVDPDKGLKKKDSYFQPKGKKEAKSKKFFESN